MTVYWGLFLTITLIQLIPVSTNNGNKTKLIISFLLLFCYAAIRVDFGHDYSVYEKAFDYIHKYLGQENFNIDFEFGYILLNKIMPSHRVLLILLSAFTCFTYYWLFQKYIPPRYYWLGFALMAICGDRLLFFQLSGLRNAITVNIMALSLPLLKERKLLLYAGLTAFACLFHVSVIFFMPLIYLVATPYKFRKISIVIWSLGVFILLLVSSVVLIDKITPLISTYFNRYSPYLDQASRMVYERSILMYGFVCSLLFMSLIILRKEDLSEDDNMIFKLVLLFIVSLILGPLDFRMSQYFAPYLVIGTTIVMDRITDPKLKYFYLGAIILFLCYSFFIVYIGNPSFPYSEYHTIFD